MTDIRQADLIASVADALQFISYFHPMDYIRALGRAYALEQGPAARDAIAQILTNSRMCAQGHRPICQDTGIVIVFAKVGMEVRFADATMGFEDMINQGVREAFLMPENRLRASVLRDPAFGRTNTGDNTPAVIYTQLVPGAEIHIELAAKGGGSENKSKFAMLNPNDDVADWVEKTVPSMGAGWCPPGMLGIGIGGTSDKALVLAKEALMEPIDMAELIARGPASKIEELRIDIYTRVNALGIGAQGLGGLSTVLDVKIREYPTHAASKPVGIVPNCAATRHIGFTLDGRGPAAFELPDLAQWPDVQWKPSPDARSVNLDALTPAEIQSWKPGDRLLLSGSMLTGRDAAHKRIHDMLAAGQPLPVSFAGRAIYYVGPVAPVRDEIVGPAGPTTATRMDKYTEMMLAQTGLAVMIGKAERGPVALDAIARHKSAYLMAVGGAAYLVSKAITASRLIAFEDLGMEAIYEFTVRDMPVTVAVDSTGTSIHNTGPLVWREKIAREKLLAIPLPGSAFPG